MIVDQKLCDSCSDQDESIELLETRFQDGRCFVELKCNRCAMYWMAEVCMPTPDDSELRNREFDYRPPNWHLVDVKPARTTSAI